MHPITTLMLSFLLYLQSEDKMDLSKAHKIEDDPTHKQFLVWQWTDFHQWNLYVYMQDAIEQYINIEEKNTINREVHEKG